MSDEFDTLVDEVSQHHAWKKDEVDYDTFIQEYPKEEPEAFRTAYQYMLDMIRDYDTETVVEQGEERTRYNVFDNEFGDGAEGVKLRGNAAFQEDLVHLLEGAANGRGPERRLIVVKGPPATGKSLVREIMTNAMEHYSETEDDGAVYTLKWDMDKVMDELETRPSPYHHPMPHQHDDEDREDRAFSEGKCPMNENPISILPDGLQQEVIDTANEHFDGEYELTYEGDPCSFCQSNFDILMERYDHDFGALLDDDAVKVQRVKLGEDTRNGFGFLDPDNSQSKKALYGKPSQGGGPHYTHMLDGELLQCNRGILFFEDIGQVVEELQGSILDYIEEHKAKPGGEPREHVDAFKMAISNLEIEDKLDNLEDDAHNELQGLGDRIRILSLGYMTEYTKEVELLKDILGTEREDMTYEALNEEHDEFFGTPHTEPIYLSNNGQEIEVMPHAMEAAGLMGAMSRIEPKDADRGGDVDKGVTVELDGDQASRLLDMKEDEIRKLDEPFEKKLDRLETAMLYAHGEIEGKDIRWDQYSDSIDPDEGLDPRALDFRFLIDNVNAAIVNSDNGIVKPDDILENIVKHSRTEPGVSDIDEEYQERVEDYIMQEWNEEALTAFSYAPGITDHLNDYVEQVFLWDDENAQQKDDFTGEWTDEDEELLNDIEDRLGIPDDEREDFRYDAIIREVAGSDKSKDEMTWEDFDRLENAISPDSWGDVLEDRDVEEGEFFSGLAHGGDHVAEHREKMVENLQKLYGYSEDSAAIVVREVAEDHRGR